MQQDGGVKGKTRNYSGYTGSDGKKSFFPSSFVSLHTLTIPNSRRWTVKSFCSANHENYGPYTMAGWIAPAGVPCSTPAGVSFPFPTRVTAAAGPLRGWPPWWWPSHFFLISNLDTSPAGWEACGRRKLDFHGSNIDLRLWYHCSKFLSGRLNL